MKNLRKFIKTTIRKYLYENMERTSYKEYNIGDVISGDKLDDLSGGLVGNDKNNYILVQQDLSIFPYTRQDLIDFDPEYADEEIWRLESMKDNFDKTPPIPQEGDGMHRIIAAKELGYKTILMWKQINYDNLFVELGFLKYYGNGTSKKINELESLLESLPKPKIIPILEDTRVEWGGVKLGESVSSEELPKIYEDMGYYADDSSNKFKGEYTLKYEPVNKNITKYSLSDDYEDLEHFDRVNEYADVLRRGEEFPPIIYTNNQFHDGAHRMAAHNDVGRKKILVFYGKRTNG